MPGTLVLLLLVGSNSLSSTPLPSFLFKPAVSLQAHGTPTSNVKRVSWEWRCWWDVNSCVREGIATAFKGGLAIGSNPRGVTMFPQISSLFPWLWQGGKEIFGQGRGILLFVNFQWVICLHWWGLEKGLRWRAMIVYKYNSGMIQGFSMVSSWEAAG